MSVWDNLLMGGYILRDGQLLAQRAAAVAEAFPICRERARDHAGSLSGGEQKLVELARTMMLDPTFIMLDEPSIGLDPRARRQVFDSITRLARAGRTILLVEQNARSGLGAADVGAVLEAGRVRLVASATALLDDPEVGRLYLGAAGSARPAQAANLREGTAPES
jgi:branched-chain amino acid transport system ATP-binding protein